MVLPISSALPVPPMPVPATVGSLVLLWGRKAELLKVAWASLFQISRSYCSASFLKLPALSSSVL
ncbi:hypothetical protein D3C81_2091710 [compost metagenome]